MNTYVRNCAIHEKMRRPALALTNAFLSPWVKQRAAPVEQLRWHSRSMVKVRIKVITYVCHTGTCTYV